MRYVSDVISNVTCNVIRNAFSLLNLKGATRAEPSLPLSIGRALDVGALQLIGQFGDVRRRKALLCEQADSVGGQMHRSHSPGVLLPLALLQLRQAQTMLSGSFEPPRERGMTWSFVNSLSVPQ